MSTLENHIYLEEKELEFQAILDMRDWGQIQDLYKEMEDDGMGHYITELSQMMTAEDVAGYKDWDKRINGSIETQMDDNS